MKISQLAPLALCLWCGCAFLTESKEDKADDSTSPIQNLASGNTEEGNAKNASVDLPLEGMTAKIRPEDMSSLYEVKPMAKAPSSKEPAATQKVYKSIKVGNEEIRVLDKTMGSVEEGAIETLRSQKKN